MVDIDKIKTFESFPFEYSEEDIIEMVKKKYPVKNRTRDFKIYQLRGIKGRMIRDILPKFKDFKDCKEDYKEVHKIVRGINHRIGIERGKLFERKFAQYLRKSGIYGEVIRDGSSGLPDIICYLKKEGGVHVLSLKTITDKSKGYSVGKKNMEPELLFAFDMFLEEYPEVKVFLVVLEFENKEIKVIEIDYSHPPERLKVF